MQRVNFAVLLKSCDDGKNLWITDIPSVASSSLTFAAFSTTALLAGEVDVIFGTPQVTLAVLAGKNPPPIVAVGAWGSASEHWLVANPGIKTALGHEPAYKLVPSASAATPCGVPSISTATSPVAVLTPPPFDSVSCHSHNKNENPRGRT